MLSWPQSTVDYPIHRANAHRDNVVEGSVGTPTDGVGSNLPRQIPATDRRGSRVDSWCGSRSAPARKSGNEQRRRWTRRSLRVRILDSNTPLPLAMPISAVRGLIDTRRTTRAEDFTINVNRDGDAVATTLCWLTITICRESFPRPRHWRIATTSQVNGQIVVGSPETWQLASLHCSENHTITLQHRSSHTHGSRMSNPDGRCPWTGLYMRFGHLETTAQIG
jgi:hypothetical protein